MKKTAGILFSILLIATVVTSCIRTNIKGFTDRDFNGYKIKKVVVRAPNSGFSLGEQIEASMVKEFAKKGVYAVSFLAMFPPTRDWTNGEVAQELAQKGFDSIMFVNLIGSDSSAQTVGYVNSGSVSVYGNNAFYTNSTTAVTHVSRYTATRIKLYEAVSGRVIWIADSSTRSGGHLYVRDEAQAGSIASETITALDESGHI